MAAADEPVVSFGASDADSIAIYSGLFNQSGGPGTPFWWDHTDLTVAVVAAPNVNPSLLHAIHDGIATWSTVLASRLPIVSLTDVTNTAFKRGHADIVVRYVPHAGGTQWGGVANCGNQRCANVIVRSDLVDGNGNTSGETDADFDALRIHRLTIHELGHALGLGHASPLEASADIMGYGWSIPNPDVTPILSDCDLDGIAAVFAWALNGEEPHPATVGSVTC
jgi:hypothetical protein